MTIEWINLRTLDGSQQKAFEELCCQVAQLEDFPKDSRFYRIEAPDAGVECYWALPNGKEVAWQAKFFLTSPNENQWKQIDKSVKTAINKHPKLSRYIVCLPINRQDPRIPDQNWFMDNWNKRVEKWNKWAKAKGSSIDFDYWGESQIIERLSKPENRGRNYFWFNKEIFDYSWFERQVKPNIANVGERYSPELNFDLPIAKKFDGLARTRKFFERLEKYYLEVKNNFDKATTPKAQESTKAEYEKLFDVIENIKSFVWDKQNDFSSSLDLNEITNLCSEGSKIANAIYLILEEKEEQLKKEFKEKREKNNPKNQNDYYRDLYSYERYYLRDVQFKFSQLSEFVNSSEAKLSNTSAMLLTGVAGNGKTHLFCDISVQRLKNNQPTILLLGQHFSNSNEPWSQIINSLSLNCTRDEFLGALEASAQSENSKALILIDALNESDYRKIWKNHLAGMLETLSNYNWISLAVSVRTTYEEAVIPDGIIPEKITKVEHYGFGEKTFEAADFFFKEYGFKAPSVPILNPEFQNPLFLKIFCNSIKNLGLSEIPKGLQGVNSIFDFFINSLNKKISEKLGFDVKENKVVAVVNDLIDNMIEKEVPYILRKDAKDIVAKTHNAQRYEETLYYHLWSEGLISEDIKYDFSSDRQDFEIVRFTYEKLTDNLIAKRILEKFLNKQNPENSFLPSEKIGKYLSDTSSIYQNKGIVEALFTQVPELLDKELFEVAPQIRDLDVTKEIFIQSLMWREPSKIFESSRQFVNEQIINYEYYHYNFIDALLTISSNPQHEWNADFLHRNLMEREMAERDAWWSIFLHEHYRNEEYSAIDRIINWAWSDSDKSHIEDESIRLCGVTLAWFLTSSNRFVRDAATKALVSLFTNRVEVLKVLIEQFINVNDLYVLERLLAVAYGCSMRSKDNNAIKKLAQFIYDRVFKDGNPIPHVLIRDYARGVIELALSRNLNVKLRVSNIRPPYKSTFPTKILSEEKLKKKYRPDYDSEESLGQRTLYDSIIEYGDFSRYIINSKLYNWRNRLLTEPLPERVIFDEFENNLTERQRKVYDQYKTVRKNIKFIEKSDKKTQLEVFKTTFTKKALKDVDIYYQEKVAKTLGKKKQKVFNEIVIPRLKNEEINREDDSFDVNLAKRWIVQRVFELGWEKELFGKFDRWLNYNTGNYRSAHKPERIGKKYQWIAFYEFMAYVTDNYQYKGDRWGETDEKFQGGWDEFRRDIDPSILLKKTQKTFHLDTHYSWWFPEKYDYENSEKDVGKWLRISDDLPKVESLIEVKKPTDNSIWLNLESYFEWSERSLFEGESGIRKLRIWYSLSSYLVKNEDFDEMMKWAKKQKFSRFEMPETGSGNYDIFLGEHYWSPVYEYFNISYYYHSGWTRHWGNKIPREILLTSEVYSHDNGGYDCSIGREDGFCITLPVKFIADKMNLNWNGVEGHFFDTNNELVAFDPSVNEQGNSSLLIRKDKFQKFLDENNLSIFWILRGEKLSYDEDIYRRKGIRPLEISGVYTLEKNNIAGKFSTTFTND